MTVGESLRSAARTLITKVFGNSATIYSYSDATKTYDDEGAESVNWGDGTDIKVVFSEFIPAFISLAPQFEETLGSGDILVRDDVTLGLKDKIVINEVNHQVDAIEETARSNDVLILQIVKIHRMES